MHLLDLIMYFVLVVLLWWILDKVSGSQWTEELGSLLGGFIVIIFTIAYIILFCFWPDWNWVDIFKGFSINVKL